MKDSKENTVTVEGDGAGNAIVVSKNNKSFGYIRVTQTRTDVDEETGFAKMVPMSALIPGELPALRSFGWKEGDQPEGKIYVKEQLTPFNTKDPDRDLKIAGETGVVCKFGDKPIYRKQFFTKNINKEDTLKLHDNTDEIKEAYAALKLEKEEEASASAHTSGIGKM